MNRPVALRKGKLLAVILLGALGALLLAQQNRPQPAKPRLDRDAAYLQAYTTEPGGVPEEKLWQVLVLFGADAQAADWNGSLSASGGEIHSVEGYRFELPDRILPQGGWQVAVKPADILAGSGLAGHGPAERQTLVLPKGLLVRGSGETRLNIQTAHGGFAVQPAALAFGAIEKHLGGRAEVRRIPPATDLSGTDLRQHDFPSIAAGSDALWITWSSYHDKQEELNFRRYKDGRWTRLLPVGRASQDLWRPHVATDESGKPWLIWSQQTGGNWDIYAMAWENNAWGELHRLSEAALPDIDPHVARGADGAIYVVWQALAGRVSQIRLKYLKQGRWSEAVTVTSSENNDWEPAVAAGPDGRVWIAWDRYTGSYDVYARSYHPSAGLGPETKVASSPNFEAHVTVAVDGKNRPWIAWEKGGVNWGKDLGWAEGPNAPGAPLGDRRRVEVVCLDGGVWKAPAEVKFGDSLEAGSTEHSTPTLFVDPNDNLWLLFQRRFARSGYRTSVHWEAFLTRLDGNRWTEPMPLPNSWTRKSVRMGLAAGGNRLWAFWPSESRSWAFASRAFSHRVVAGSLPLPAKGAEPVLAEYRPEAVRAPEVHPNEPRDVAAIRGHRVKAGPESLRIVRGDLHRHTEFSPDAGGLGDGTLQEFYRYMIDAASMDFGASTDHQAGGIDYWDFFTRKMTDMYHFPERYSTLYGYERNMGNPHGHRNIIHTTRNYPVVPFYQTIDTRFMLPDAPDGEILTFNSNSYGGAVENDTKLLYDELRKSGGLAISHTSASNGMGTDWRDNDPKLEPVVEIYQGARYNAEHKNAPRGAKDGQENNVPGGFQQPGLVWNAWKKGYRLGVITSSDHYSTHISYAMVYTPDTSRKSIFHSMLKRRTYGATDNIILEFWLGDHFMGDEFTASKPQKIRVRAQGTNTIDTIHLIRDGVFIYKVSPGKQEAEFDYMDANPGKGEHWYYVRVEQQDGELAWSSPIWVKY